MTCAEKGLRCKLRVGDFPPFTFKGGKWKKMFVCDECGQGVDVELDGENLIPKDKSVIN